MLNHMNDPHLSSGEGSKDTKTDNAFYNKKMTIKMNDGAEDLKRQAPKGSKDAAEDDKVTLVSIFPRMNDGMADSSPSSEVPQNKTSSS